MEKVKLEKNTVDINSLYRVGYERLAASLVPDSRLDARYLLEYATGVSSSEMLLEPDMPVNENDCKRYLDAIDMRAARIPLQYITGSQEFMGLKFKVSPSVLIPRQDTEVLVENVLGYADGARILDMCTGSGCIAVSIAKLGNPAMVTAVDISQPALEIAQENAQMNGVADRIHFVKSDLFGELDIPVADEDKYDIIVSNPPYIPCDVVKTLMPEVREHEPMIALEAAENGMEFYSRITVAATLYLKKGGRLIYEIGCEQADDVKKILEDNLFSGISIIKDYASLNRVVGAVWGCQEEKSNV